MSKSLPRFSGDYLARLQVLFLERSEKVKRSEKIDFMADGGEKLYQDALDGIVAMMVKIKTEQGEKVAGCNLFDNALDPVWQKKFKKNCYKLFIDRIRCDDSLPFPHRVFNRSSLEGNDSGADLCYAEAFAVGFISMLQLVEAELQKDHKTDLSEDEFLDLFQELNAISVGTPGQKQTHDLEIFAGHFALGETAKERKEIRDLYGRNSLFFEVDGSAVNNFSEEFDHASCAKHFYRIYREKIAAGADVQNCLCELVDTLGTDVHLDRDGNGRAAILLAWFLAISQNKSCLIPFDQYFSHPAILEEAKMWSAVFMRDPDMDPAPEKSAIYYLSAREQVKINAPKYEKTANQVAIDSAGDNKVLVFFCDLMKNWCSAERVFCNPKILLNQKLYVFESAQEEGKFIIANRVEAGCDEDMATAANLRYLDRAVKNNQAELDAEKNIALRNSKIALFFMREIVSPDLELSEEDKMVAKIVMRSVEGKHLILNVEQAEEFKHLAAVYLDRIKPAPTPSNADVAMSNLAVTI